MGDLVGDLVRSVRFGRDIGGVWRGLLRHSSLICVADLKGGGRGVQGSELKTQ